MATAATILDSLDRVSASQLTYKVTAVLNVYVVDINVVQLHAPQAGELSRVLQSLAGLPGLLYDGRDLLQALRGDIHIRRLYAHLVLIGHLDGQILQEPWVVLDLWDCYPLHEKDDKNAAVLLFLLQMMFQGNYLLRVRHKDPRQQMSALH